MKNFDISERTVERYVTEIAEAEDPSGFHYCRGMMARRRFLRALGLFIPSLKFCGAELLCRIVRVHAGVPVRLGRRVLDLGRWLVAVWSDEVWWGRGDLPSVGELRVDDTTLIDAMFSEADWQRVLELGAWRPALAVTNACLRRLLSRRLTRPKTVVITEREQAQHGAVRAGIGRELAKLPWHELPIFMLHDLGVGAAEERVFQQLYREAVSDDGRAWDLTARIMDYYKFPVTAEGVRRYIGLIEDQFGPEDGRLETLPHLGAAVAARVGFLWHEHRQDFGPMPPQIAEGLRTWGRELSDGKLIALLDACVI